MHIELRWPASETLFAIAVALAVAFHIGAWLRSEAKGHDKRQSGTNVGGCVGDDTRNKHSNTAHALNVFLRCSADPIAVRAAKPRQSVDAPARVKVQTPCLPMLGCFGRTGYQANRVVSSSKTPAATTATVGRSRDVDLDNFSCCDLVRTFVDYEADNKLMLARECARELAARGVIADSNSCTSAAGTIAARKQSISDQDKKAAQKLAAEPSVKALLKEVAARAGAVDFSRSELASDEGWELQRDRDGIRTMYRGSAGGSPLIRIRIEGFIEAPVFNMLALLYEVDLFHLWLPFFAGIGLKSVEMVAEASPTRRIYHGIISLPWPFQNRDVIVAVEGVDAMNATDPIRQIIILCDSNPAAFFPAECLSQIPSVSPGCTRMELKDAAVVLTPAEVLPEEAQRGSAGCLYQFVGTADVKTAFPAWLVNVITRQLMFLVIVGMRRYISLTFGEQFQPRMCNPKSPFYTMIRRRLAEELPVQHSQLPPVR